MDYELTILIKPDEEDVAKVVADITKEIESLDGEVKSTDVLGLKRLAYPIKLYEKAYYYIINCKLDGKESDRLDGTAGELANNVSRHPSVMRYLLVSLDPLKNQLRDFGY